MLALREKAQAMGVDTVKLARDLLETIAKDNLYVAVLIWKRPLDHEDGSAWAFTWCGALFALLLYGFGRLGSIAMMVASIDVSIFAMAAASGTSSSTSLATRSRRC